MHPATLILVGFALAVTVMACLRIRRSVRRHNGKDRRGR